MASEARPQSFEHPTPGDNFSWPEVKALFEAALALHGEERELFVKHSCAGNVALREEVETLLASYEETGEFLENPIASVPSFFDGEILPPEKEKLIGTR